MNAKEREAFKIENIEETFINSFIGYWQKAMDDFTDHCWKKLNRQARSRFKTLRGYYKKS